MNNNEAIRNVRRNFDGLIDVTLREGEQFSGPMGLNENGEAALIPHEFSFQEAQTILSLLNQIGVQKAEVSNPLAQGMASQIKQLCHMQGRPELFAHIRNHPRDAQAAFDLRKDGLDGIHILTTVDERRLGQMGQTLPAYINQMEKIVKEAQCLGMETRVGVEHSWDNPFEETLPVWQAAYKIGVDRISVADTTGHATHWEVEQKMNLIRKFLPHIKIGVHFHNDFLSAITNSLEAVANGANYVDTSLAGGIGERTGIASLSVFLARLGQLDPKLVEKYHTELLTIADNTVAGMLGIALPFNVVTAPNAFAHRAGLHIDGIKKNGADLYEPINPKSVGGTRHITTGTNISGRTTSEEARSLIAATI